MQRSPSQTPPSSLPSLSRRALPLLAALGLLVALLAPEAQAQTPRGAGSTLTVTTAELPPLNVLELYRATLAAEGGVPPYTWSVEGLPGGLVLDPAGGVIASDPESSAVTGVPPAALSVTVTDAAGGTATAELPLAVIVVERVAVGQEHACAVTSASTVYCWGRNVSGQLGDGTTEDRLSPVAVRHPDDPAGLVSGVVDITASEAHTCAVTDDGAVYCWGFNGAGRLGLGSGTAEVIPVPGRVVGPAGGGAFLTGVSAVAAGNMHTCALTESGIAYCWGDNFRGQIGRPVQTGGTPIAVGSPGDHEQPLSGLAAIGAGGFHTCAVTTAGTGYCWGWNNAGQLGVGQTFPVQSSTPLVVRDPANLDVALTGLAHVGGGGVHTCAGTTSGVGYCWGQNAHGQVGNGNAPVNSLAPALVADPANPDAALGGLASVGPGTIHSCARAASGTAYCWGNNEEGQLGNGTNQSSDLAVAVAGPEGTTGPLSDLQALAHRGWQTCGLTEAGALYCWGYNAYGQLGDGTTENRNRPVAVRPGRPAGALPALTPSPLAFGEVPVGQTAGPLELTLTNLGTAALDVTDVAAPSVPFVFAGGTCGAAPFQLAADESCTLGVSFTPVAAGAWAGTLALTSNAGTHTATLTGTGIGDEHPAQVRLVAADGAAGDWFGRSVVIDGNTLLVSADAVDIDGSLNRGAVYVFVRAGGTWVQQARLTASDGAQFNQFGMTVALSGNTALVGTGNAGAAYVFRRTGETWHEEAKLTAGAGAPPSNFGLYVALDGDTAVIGADQTDVDGQMNRGAAYVFVRTGTTWTQQARLTASNGQPFDLLGMAVAISGETVVIGGPYVDPDGATNQGAAYVFTRSGSTWTEQAMLTASDGAAGHLLGSAVAISGDLVVAGAPLAGSGQGAAYVFTRTGTTWTQQARLAPTDGVPSGQFGSAVAAHGETVLVGALFANDFGGAAYRFTREGGSWDAGVALVPEGGSAGDQFGNAVALGSGLAVVGAWQTEVGGAGSQGAAYVFRLGEGPLPALVFTPSLTTGLSVTVPEGESTSASLTLTNDGSEPLAFTFVAPPAFVTAIQPPEGTLAPGGEAVVAVTFSAAGLTAGTYEGTVTVQTDEPLEYAYPLTLVVTGDGAMSISPSPLAFGGVVVGTSATETVTITNTGTGTVAVEAVEASPAAYTVAFTGPVTLAPGQSTTADVTFAPTAPGEATGTLTVLSDAPGGPATAALSGIGMAPPVAALSSDGLVFELAPGQTLSQTVTLANQAGAGAADLEFAVGVVPAGGARPGGHPETRGVAGAGRSGSRPGPAARTGTAAVTGEALPQTRFAAGGGDIVQDGSFEAYTPNPYWTEFSLNFGTPLCTQSDCGLGSGSGPRTGAAWAWFGGAGQYEEGSVEQQVVIPPGTAELSFYLEIPVAQVPATLDVLLDGDVLFSVSEADAAGYATYQPVVLDVSAYADGGTHTLRFASTQHGTGGSFGLVTNIFVDDVHVAASGPVTLSADPEAGSVAPGASVELTLSAHAIEGAEGLHHFEVLVHTNDPANPVLTLPVSVLVSTDAEEGAAQAVFALDQNYPNPFAGRTTIGYALAEAGPVRIDVFDAAGRRVATLVDAPLAAGPHTVEWDASGLAAGVYFYRIQSGPYSETVRALVVR